MILQSKLFSQNLVPNYSYEFVTGCTPVNNVLNCPPWFTPDITGNGSPDNFNTCFNPTAPPRGVPSNGFGYQFPRTGNAYAGIIVYGNGNVREYIEAPLINPLIIGKRYCVEFYVSLANGTGIAIDALGALFSTDSVLNGTNTYIPATPQASNAVNNIITDTANWVLISQSFIADSAYKFITIGNFKDNAGTNDSIVQSWPPEGYYYIEDVSVMCCDPSGNCDPPTPPSSLSSIANIFTPNNDGVNDVFEIQSTSLEDFKLSIFNRWGTKVYDFISPNDAWDGYTTTGEPCSEGVYFYFLTAKGEDGKEYEEKGCIQLLR